MFGSSRLKKILGLSLPITMVMLAYHMMGVIDTAMVGRLGDEALAGVGIGSTLFSMLMAILFGVDSGVQAIVARRVGEGRPDVAGRTLNSAIATSFPAGLLLLAIGYLVLPHVYALVVQDPKVAARGLPFLMAILPMLVLAGVNSSFSAYWNGSGSPKWSLLAILVQLVSNVVFNYLLIFGKLGLPKLETVGAGIGSVLAALVATATHFTLALRYARKDGFLSSLPDIRSIATIVRLGFPVSLQQFFLYVGTSVFFMIVGLIGTRELAALNVMIVVILMAVLPSIGMGIACATLVGQALGKNQVGEARRTGWEVASLGGMVMLLFSVVVFLVPELVLRMFLVDPGTLKLASTPLRIMVMGVWIDTFGRIIGFSLRGAGSTKVVTSVAFLMQWGFQLPLHWLIGVHLGYGLTGIAVVGILVTVLETTVVCLIWHGGRWSLATV